MSLCEHCQGQRFDRARVLRALRQVKKDLKVSNSGTEVEAALVKALSAVRALDVPHLGPGDEEEDVVVH